MINRLDPSKITKSRFSGVLLILFIVGLYFTLNKAVVPFTEKVVESDLFVADTSELGGKDRSKIAMLQCNDFIRSELDDPGATLEFGNNDAKAWELADGRYLVKSHLIEQDASGKQIRKNFACNVQYTGGDDTDHSNWSLQGLEIREL